MSRLRPKRRGWETGRLKDFLPGDSLLHTLVERRLSWHPGGSDGSVQQSSPQSKQPEVHSMFLNPVDCMLLIRKCPSNTTKQSKLPHVARNVDKHAHRALDPRSHSFDKIHFSISGRHSCARAHANLHSLGFDSGFPPRTLPVPGFRSNPSAPTQLAE